MHDIERLSNFKGAWVTVHLIHEESFRSYLTNITTDGLIFNDIDEDGEDYHYYVPFNKLLYLEAIGSENDVITAEREKSDAVKPTPNSEPYSNKYRDG